MAIQIIANLAHVSHLVTATDRKYVRGTIEMAAEIGRRNRNGIVCGTESVSARPTLKISRPNGIQCVNRAALSKYFQIKGELFPNKRQCCLMIVVASVLWLFEQCGMRISVFKN